MDIVSIFQRFRPSAASCSACESIKFERSGNPAFTIKTQGWSGQAPSPWVYPLFFAAFYYLFTPAAYPAFQNLILLVTS
jgi:hypothetical protein